MPVLRDATGVIAEGWVRAEAPVPGRPTILPWPQELTGNDPALTGIHIGNDTEAASLVESFPRIALISIAFPGFSDGRGLSVARRLRRLGFTGRLRAAGPVIADQFDYLLACGFDEVETPEALDARQPQAQWERARGLVTLGYQRGYSGRSNILEARRAARAKP